MDDLPHTIANWWGKNPSVLIACAAILISLCSLMIAALSLGWNIYRDLWQRGRLKLSLMNGVAVVTPEPPYEPRLTLTIANYGPKKTRATFLVLRKNCWWKRPFRRETHAILMHDYADPLSGKIPCDLDVGEAVTLTFRHVPDLFLNKDFDQVGIIDPFGIKHWCARMNYRDVKAAYLKKKGPTTTNRD